MPIKTFTYDAPPFGKLIEYEIVGEDLLSVAEEIKFYNRRIPGDVNGYKFAFSLGRHRTIFFSPFFDVGNPFFNGVGLNVVFNKSQHGERGMKSPSYVVDISIVMDSTDVSRGDHLLNRLLIGLCAAKSKYRKEQC